jgi:hypothetical protein
LLIDLNARRAARVAKGQEPMVVRVGDRDYELANMISIRTMELVNDGDIPGAAKLMLKEPDDWAEFAANVDMNELGHIITSYGTRMGESSASTDSSVDTGEQSRPTSDDSTDSASETVATDETPSV